jgi:hypothetical protein
MGDPASVGDSASVQWGQVVADAREPAAKGTGQGAATPTPRPAPVRRTPQPQAPQPSTTTLSPELLEAQSKEHQAHAKYDTAKNTFDGILKGKHTAEQLANAATALENAAQDWEDASYGALNRASPHADSPEFVIAEKNYYAANKEVSYAQDQVVKYVWHVDPTKDFFTPSSSVRLVAHQTPPDIARAKKRELDQISKELTAKEKNASSRNQPEVDRLRARYLEVAQEEYGALAEVYRYLVPNDYRPSTPAFESCEKEYARLGKLLEVTRPG